MVYAREVPILCAFSHVLVAPISDRTMLVLVNQKQRFGSPSIFREPQLLATTNNISSFHVNRGREPVYLVETVALGTSRENFWEPKRYSVSPLYARYCILSLSAQLPLSRSPCIYPHHAPCRYSQRKGNRNSELNLQTSSDACEQRLRPGLGPGGREHGVVRLQEDLAGFADLNSCVRVPGRLEYRVFE